MNLEAISAADRALIARVWYGRAEAELRASHSFERIREHLVAAQAEPELVDIATRAIADEHRHAALCHALACTYHGGELPDTKLILHPLPEYQAAPEWARPTLHVVAQCCLNETTASAFLKGCLDRATAPEVRETLRALLSDEIDHARIGWAHLASPRVTAETRGVVEQLLVPLLHANLGVWRGRLEAPLTDVHSAHGCSPWEAVDRDVLASVSDVILPGFRTLGFRVDAAEAWLREAEGASGKTVT